MVFFERREERGVDDALSMINEGLGKRNFAFRKTSFLCYSTALVGRLAF
jgi:hypothetical protein